jgi:hypothetical protein
MHKTLLFFLIVLLVGTPANGEQRSNLEPSDFPSLVSSVRISSPIDFCKETVPLENQEIRERLEKELLLSLWDRPQVILWIKRSNRYLPHIEKMLRKNNLPDDLKYVAIIESALRPHVGSPKGAIGFWQFMKPTGQKYGLIVDGNLDQRRNIFASTLAAIRYFKDLYEMLGSWTLSVAGYNMGEHGLQSEIMTQQTNQYYQLYLPLETQRYVFRIISAKIILSKPEKYGFRLAKKDLYPPMRFDRVQLKFSQQTPILMIAKAAKTTFKVIKDLNPEIRGHYMSKGSHSILIPKGGAKGFQARYSKLLRQWQAQNEHHIYEVKKGDNLSSIADRFNVPLPALVTWNHLDLNKHIQPGDRLIIYSRKTKSYRKPRN